MAITPTILDVFTIFTDMRTSVWVKLWVMVNEMMLK